MRKIFLFFLFLCLILLSGCQNNFQIDEITFVVSIGIDYIPDTKEYDVTIYIINTFNSNNAQLGASDPDILAYTANSKAKSISEAMEKIKSNSDVTLDFRHVKTIILTEKFFNDNNAFYFLDFFQSNPAFYTSYEVYVTDAPINKLFNVDNMMETSAFNTLLTGKKKNHNFNKVKFLDYANINLIDNYCVPLPLISVSETTFSKQDKPYLTINHSGYSFVKDSKLTTFKLESFPELIFLSDINNYSTTIADIEIFIESYKITKYFRNNKFNINIRVKLDVLESSKNKLNDELKENVKKDFINKLNKVYTIMKEQNIDIFNILFISHNKIQCYKSCDIVYEIDLALT